MKLSVRETQVLTLICEGFSPKEIASMMDKSYHTIRNHIHHIRLKTDCHKVATMVMWTVEHRVVNPRS